MEMTFKVIPANVFNELMDSGKISMGDLVEQLVMDEFHTKNNLTPDDIKSLRTLIEYIDEE